MGQPMPPDPLVGKVLADRFEVLERIGDGGTGVVYRAKQLSVDRIIAVKVLGAHVSTDPQWMKRFQLEARAASKLEHPNTVRVIDFGQTREGLLFIAMEYLHGRSLRAEIEQQKRLPPNRVLPIVSQICASLSEAHAQGIIHRDIKPDNIYLTELKGAGDFVKVLDFSVAKLDAPDAQLTRAGVVFGTPAYMSPEQGRGVPLDPRSDIYAVGIVAYEMLSGKPPFDGNIPTEVVMMHLRNQPPPLQGVPLQLSAIVMRALEKDPKQRQQSADELDQQCQRCLLELYPRNTPGAGLPRASGSEPSVRSYPGLIAPAPATEPPRKGRTMALGAVPPPAAPAERKTVALPETEGKIAYAEPARRARAAAQASEDDAAGALFWLAWVLLGIGGGLAVHFFMLHAR
jgi:serine/threonine-protein kinase